MKSCLLGYPVPKEPHKLNALSCLVMSMPETGFFFPGLFHIPHPEDGERKIHLDGWMEMERMLSASKACFMSSGRPLILSVDSSWIAHFNLSISLNRGSKDFRVL
jgi:hypothetical protein